ncbi:MAG TPA: glycosyltransferase family 4 protein [Polyangia bacterium]|nr:glycosyltransferase family 4 protein [Polyangia bacterium]
MRIALISTPFVRVPPPSYGGTELIVAELAAGLTAAGHRVTLFATGDSRAAGDVRACYATAQWPPDPYPELDHVGFAVEQILADAEGFDVVHAHVPSALPFAPLLDVPMAYTVHHERDPRLASLYRRSRAQLIAISARQRDLAPELGDALVIHHGLSPDRYPLGDGAGGYVAYLGRFAREKGVHFAVDAARAARVPIRLAGRPHCHDERYFADELASRLALPGVRAVGEVGGAPKTRFLGGARALLFPICWEEPFGLVMIEAMLCGTPVLAFDRGSVREVIDEGVTGFVCRDVDGLAARLRQFAAGGFDRRRCAARARERWSASRMVAEHLALYRQLANLETMNVRAAAPVS